jgi:hypothetical protein
MEFEELKLSVSLTDNATAGLKGLQAEVEKLAGIGGESARRIGENFQETGPKARGRRGTNTHLTFDA